MARLLQPRTAGVVHVIKDQLHHQTCQRRAGLLRKRAPRWRRHGLAAGCGKQIELCRPGSMVVTHIAPHRGLPDSHRERPSVRREQGHSMVRRPCPPPLLAASLTRPERRRRPKGGCPCASTHMPPGRTSTSAIPTSDTPPRHPGCTGRHCRSPSLPPHGSGLCTPPKDATGRRLPASPSCGSSGAVLYNPRRRHSSLGYLSPIKFEGQFAEPTLEPGASELAVVLAPVKERPGNVTAGCTDSAPAVLDRRSTRQPWKPAGRDEKMLSAEPKDRPKQEDRMPSTQIP